MAAILDQAGGTLLDEAAAGILDEAGGSAGDSAVGRLTASDSPGAGGTLTAADQ
jgi:hypothetical protein